jgi:hypothetical protein
VPVESAEQSHHRSKLVAHILILALVVYVVFIQLQSIYFGAFFFGQQPPSWLSWVGNLPFWGLDVLATIGVLIVAGLVIVAHQEHTRGRPRRLSGHRRGSAAVGALVAIVILVILFAILNLGFGLTLQSLIGGLRGFLGV